MTQDTDLVAFLTEVGDPPTTPAHARALGQGDYTLAKPLMFHWTVIHGEVGDMTGYWDRWCFATEALALEAVAAWPMVTPAKYDPIGWHRHPSTGRRRDFGNPEFEHVEF